MADDKGPSQEFDSDEIELPDGQMIVVDVFNREDTESMHGGEAIMIAVFPTEDDAHDVSMAILPSPQQWEIAKHRVIEVIEKALSKRSKG